MIREKRGGLLVALATALAMCVGPYACSSSGALSGLGGPCSQFSDCQQDLICGKGPDGTRVCTNDPSGLQPPQGKDAGGKNPMMPGETRRRPETRTTTFPRQSATRSRPRRVRRGRMPGCGTPGSQSIPAKSEDTGMPEEAAPVPEAGGTDGATE